MTQQSLYERIMDHVLMCRNTDYIDDDYIKVICHEYEQRIEELERTNELLSRSVLPDGHWAAPINPTYQMIHAGRYSMSTIPSIYSAMRDKYLERRK